MLVALAHKVAANKMFSRLPGFFLLFAQELSDTELSFLGGLAN